VGKTVSQERLVSGAGKSQLFVAGIGQKMLAWRCPNTPEAGVIVMGKEKGAQKRTREGEEPCNIY
jgi:hypothetical protein